MATIVIDPGHGGADIGAAYYGRQEKNDNLSLARLVRNRLTAAGHKVVMTRDADVAVSLAERANISNRNNADLFLSIHRNASTDPSANGVETYVHPAASQKTVDYAARTLNGIVNVGGMRNRGLHKASFQVLRDTRAPAQLLEMGFISNAQDNASFDNNLNRYADAIAQSILATLGETTSPTTKRVLTAELQAALNSAYGAGLAVDGIFGPKTKSAIRSVRRGDKGTVVRVLQAALTLNGYPATADGIFGPLTENIVRSFQAANGLAVDGIAGPNTFAALLS